MNVIGIENAQFVSVRLWFLYAINTHRVQVLTFGLNFRDNEQTPM